MGWFTKNRRDALKISDWLLNMRDVFLAEGTAKLDQDPSAPDVLAYFTLSSAVQSGYNVLHCDSNIVIDNCQRNGTCHTFSPAALKNADSSRL